MALVGLLGPIFVVFVVLAMLAVAVLMLLSVWFGDTKDGYLIILLSLLVAGIILRAMWFRTRAPEGVALHAESGTHPGALLEEVRNAFGPPVTLVCAARVCSTTPQQAGDCA